MAVRQNKGVPIERTYTGAVLFAPNSQATFDLDVNALIEEISMQMTGTLTLAGWTAAPTIRKEGIENLFSRVAFQANAKQNGAQAVNLVSTDAAFLAFKTAITETTFPDRVDVSNANGAHDFESNFTKYFGATMFPAIKDATYLDTRLLQSLRLAFSCRDVNAMVKPGTGTGGGTAVLSDVQVVVHSREWQGHQTAAKAPYIKETQREFDLSNLSGLDKDFKDIPIGNILARQTFKGCVGDVDYAEPSDAFFATTQRTEGPHVKTTVTGQGGNVTPFDVVYDVLQSQNRLNYNLEDWPVGYAVYEPGERTRSPKQALNLRNMLSAKNTLDVTPVAGQTNTLWITDEQLVSN